MHGTDGLAGCGEYSYEGPHHFSFQEHPDPDEDTEREDTKPSRDHVGRDAGVTKGRIPDDPVIGGRDHRGVSSTAVLAQRPAYKCTTVLAYPAEEYGGQQQFSGRRSEDCMEGPGRNFGRGKIAWMSGCSAAGSSGNMTQDEPPVCFVMSDTWSGR